MDLFFALGAEPLARMIEDLEKYDVFSRIKVCICYELALQFAGESFAAQEFFKELNTLYKSQRKRFDEIESERIYLEICTLNAAFGIMKGGVRKTKYYLKEIITNQHIKPLFIDFSYLLNMYFQEFTLLSTVFSFSGHINDYMYYMSITNYQFYKFMEKNIKIKVG